MATTVLVERGFSRMEIVEFMKKADSGLTVYGTHEQPYEDCPTVMLPPLETPEGIAQANALIAKHGIDAFWPQKSAEYDLSRLDCAVHTAADPATIALVNDKERFAAWLDDDIYRARSVGVLGADGVAEAIRDWRATDRPVCVKPVDGIYGQGYWRLVENGVSLLDEPSGREISPNLYLAALRSEELVTGRRRMLVMDWLPGPEVSVDMLSWHGRPLIHAARTKLSDSLQRIESEHPVIGHARAMVGKLGLHGVTSMQYRMSLQGDWKMLEVNPRPAGGSINGEDAGFGLLAAWARLLTGSVGPDDIKQVDATVDLRISRMATIT